ncbi:copper amine oxidase N-terminal domain-containing protein [Oscillospiraceae bacterium OttesenSCG-928-G22]|nr:copper amine oxidase N-terminal domain-containing protein [Oscillospiraceae bacterium OttesenSCG-928-G22]
MKRFKTILSFALVLTLLAMPVLTASAADEGADVPGAYFVSFSGTVESVTPFYESDESIREGTNFVLVKNEEGALFNFLVTPDTYMVTDKAPEAGDEFVGYYPVNRPMLMIYPPQAVPTVAAVNLGKTVIKVDRFDENLLSQDGDLRIVPGDKTEIVTPDGTAFEGSLENRNLVVFYSVVATSLPAQTNPEKIVVLPEPEEAGGLTEEDIQNLIETVPDMPIVVENEKIDAPAPYATDTGTVMVPLRAVAEALGETVSWNQELKRVTIGITITLDIGSDYYTFAKMAPISLGAAPALKDCVTYVPLQFFTDVMRLNNAYVFEGQIVIDNGELMN